MQAFSTLKGLTQLLNCKICICLMNYMLKRSDSWSNPTAPKTFFPTPIGFLHSNPWQDAIWIYFISTAIFPGYCLHLYKWHYLKILLILFAAKM